MPECARCGDFTDTPPDGEYHYCESCRDHFAEIREHGIVVTGPDGGEYAVTVAAGGDYSGGTERSQTDALARAKQLADQLDADALFEYDQSGSRWVLEEYLQAHPEIRRDVQERLRRAPDRGDEGLLARVRRLFSRT